MPMYSNGRENSLRNYKVLVQVQSWVSKKQTKVEEKMLIMLAIVIYLIIGFIIASNLDLDNHEFGLIALYLMTLFWLPYFLFNILCLIFKSVCDVLFSLGD